MQPALAWAERILRALIGGGFLFALALNFANVVMRYAFHAPIYWAEEAMIFTFIWCVFLGGAVVTLSGEHLRVEFLEWALSPRLRQILRFVIHVVSAAVMLFVFWRAWSLVGMLVRLQQKSTIAEIPMWVPYGAVLVGSLLLSIASGIRAIRVLFGPLEQTNLQPVA